MLKVPINFRRILILSNVSKVIEKRLRPYRRTNIKWAGASTNKRRTRVAELVPPLSWVPIAHVPEMLICSFNHSSPCLADSLEEAGIQVSKQWLPSMCESAPHIRDRTRPVPRTRPAESARTWARCSLRSTGRSLSRCSSWTYHLSPWRSPYAQFFGE